MKACSCGVAGCSRLAPADGHAWDPLAEPVDDCGLCWGALDLMPGVRCDVRAGRQPMQGPAQLPVQFGSGYAHPECAAR
jgi:hypothetical protein